MARIRSVKPEFWGDRKLAASVSRDARLLYIALWNQADEWARVQGDARWIKGHCLPYDDDLNLAAIDGLVDELAAAGRVQRYEHEGDPYLFLPKLAPHQRLEPAKVPSRLPEPPAPPDLSVSAPESESRADESERRADSHETIDALHVAGGRLQVAGSRGVGAAAPRADCTDLAVPDTAQTLIAEHIDACRKRPPDRVVGQLSRGTGELLGEGFTAEDIRGGLAIVRERGLHPSALASAVDQAVNRPTRRSTTDQRSGEGLDLAAQLRAEGR